MLKIVCPKCKRKVEISEDKLGEVVTCDSCKKQFRASRAFVSEAAPPPSASDVPAGNISSDVPSSSDHTPGAEAESPAPDITDGFFHEIDYRGRHFTVKDLKKLKNRFVIFSVLILFIISCFGSAVGEFSPGFAAVAKWLGALPFGLVIFFLVVLFVYFYSRLFLALKEPEFLIKLKMLLLISPIAFAFVSVFAEDFFNSFKARNFSWFTSVLFCLIGICILKAIIETILVLWFATSPSGGAKTYSKIAKRISMILLPVFISLFMSIFFGSLFKTNELCDNCGILTVKNDVYCSGLRLFSFTGYKQTAFSRFLDPEHQCHHNGGKRFISNDAINMLEKMLHKQRVDSLHEKTANDNDRLEEINEHYRLVYTSSVPFYRKSRRVDEYIENLTNIEEDSPLYEYLCEKDSQSFARRLIISDLTAEEVDDFYKKLVPYYDEDHYISTTDPGAEIGSIFDAIE